MSSFDESDGTRMALWFEFSLVLGFESTLLDFEKSRGPFFLFGILFDVEVLLMTSSHFSCRCSHREISHCLASTETVIVTVTAFWLN